MIEGTRRRIQVFEGVVIKRQGHGARETFTVRKQSFGVGVERMFPVHSPKIERIELASRGDVRRAKLYYLRDRVGKRARVRERRYTGPEETVQPGLLHEQEPAQATDAEGASAEEALAEPDGRERREHGRERDSSREPDGGCVRRGDAPRQSRSSLSPVTLKRPTQSQRNPPPMPVARPPAAPRRDASPHGGWGARAAMGVRSAKRLGSSKGGDLTGGSSPTATPGQTPGKSSAPTKATKSTTNSIIELVAIVVIAVLLAVGIQAFLVKPYRIPERLYGTDARRRPARARQPHRDRLRQTTRRRDRGLSST